LVIVALWHWETLNGHGGTIRPLVACFIEVSRITAPSGRWVCQLRLLKPSLSLVSQHAL